MKKPEAAERSQPVASLTPNYESGAADHAGRPCQVPSDDFRQGAGHAEAQPYLPILYPGGKRLEG
jgi:hypothetical protein